ncbi:head GIN domain-containing protein [Flavobacterium eburneipallidum]|uniref:head GIN domain-containing protein n=1 Tax=Flavobacterium eburneipallidum TaxID=3003263 RepID=UPI0024825FC0|nr:head GIN domain-containing protein [Flavobacterium eburneipallidum]
MKKVLIIAAVLVSQFTFAQVTKNVGDFDKVTGFDKIKVKLVAASQNKVELKGKYEGEAEVINNNGELKIRLPLGKFLNGEDLLATVYFKKLEGIEANEGSYISCETEIKAINFKLLAKEGSRINATINAKKISVTSSSGSEVELAGTTQNLDVVTNAGGKFQGKDCNATQATVSVNAGGFADVYATDLVDAKTRAGGTITIYGKPKQINQKTVLGGTIKEN